MKNMVLKLMAIALFPMQVMAACDENPTCEALGFAYTEGNCEGLAKLKCPFGNSYFCAFCDNSVGYYNECPTGVSCQAVKTNTGNCQQATGCDERNNWYDQALYTDVTDWSSTTLPQNYNDQSGVQHTCAKRERFIIIDEGDFCNETNNKVYKSKLACNRDTLLMKDGLTSVVSCDNTCIGVNTGTTYYYPTCVSGYETTEYTTGNNCCLEDYETSEGNSFDPGTPCTMTLALCVQSGGIWNSTTKTCRKDGKVLECAPVSGTNTGNTITYSPVYQCKNIIVTEYHLGTGEGHDVCYVPSEKCTINRVDSSMCDACENTSIGVGDEDLPDIGTGIGSRCLSHDECEQAHTGEVGQCCKKAVGSSCYRWLSGSSTICAYI